MTERGLMWVGADPGGDGKFGIAILTEGEQPQTSSVDYADEAIDFVSKHLARTLAGVGVDAPLWWSSGRSGDRLADQWLRKRYGLSGGEVQTTNSLRGAALIQGAMFVQRMRGLFPAVGVTESHPKVLLKVFAQGDWKTFADRFGIKTDISNDHERDALIAAVSAREGFQNRWTHDLSIKRLPPEQNPRSYWLAPVYYFWPEE